MYWKIGERIVIEEKKSQERAEYGKYMIRHLAKKLQNKYGSGFSKRILYRAVQFYNVYPIVSAVPTQFNWMQCYLLSSIENTDKRTFYEYEAIKNNWSGRELERQINSLFYERLCLSSDKNTVLKYAKKNQIVESPTDIIKDPMMLEFLNLKDNASYRESELESAIITQLESFMLELGNGFAFMARQKRIVIEDDNFYIDLVFYNRLLQAHVIIEIKTRPLTHEDLGQLQMYVNYYDRMEKLDHENETIGILLCTKKNDSLVKFSLPKNNKNILASKYELFLPTKDQLLKEIIKIEEKFEKEKR